MVCFETFRLFGINSGGAYFEFQVNHSKLNKIKYNSHFWRRQIIQNEARQISVKKQTRHTNIFNAGFLSIHQSFIVQFKHGLKKTQLMSSN